MAVRRKGSISAPIIFGSVAVVLTVFILIGWIYVILKNIQLTQHWVASNVLLLVSGILSLTTIMTVVIMFSIVLAKQILENRRQTTFIDSVTHELRSPLASLRLSLETMGRPDLPPPQRQRLQEMMLADTERLSAFIDDILEATRIEHGRESFSIATITLRDFVQRSADTVTRRHKIANDQIAIEIDPAMQLAIDPTALDVILKNLLDNAVKYSNHPAEVRVRAFTLANGRPRIEVSDCGVGIPRNKLKRVFDRFYRVDDESVRARRGTGLGLYVVKALVRSLRGHLTAHSEGLGHGALFTITLPTNSLVHIGEPTN